MLCRCPDGTESPWVSPQHLLFRFIFHFHWSGTVRQVNAASRSIHPPKYLTNSTLSILIEPRGPRKAT